MDGTIITIFISKLINKPSLHLRQIVAVSVFFFSCRERQNGLFTICCAIIQTRAAPLMIHVIPVDTWRQQQQRLVVEVDVGERSRLCRYGSKGSNAAAPPPRTSTSKQQLRTGPRRRCFKQSGQTKRGNETKKRMLRKNMEKIVNGRQKHHQSTQLVVINRHPSQ